MDEVGTVCSNDEVENIKLRASMLSTMNQILNDIQIDDNEAWCMLVTSELSGLMGNVNKTAEMAYHLTKAIENLVIKASTPQELGYTLMAIKQGNKELYETIDRVLEEKNDPARCELRNLKIGEDDENSKH